MILVDRLDRLVSAIRNAQMFAAAFGDLTPVQGALLQEGIEIGRSLCISSIRLRDIKVLRARPDQNIRKV
ncbi:hypothetical protein HFN60_33700 [Rhizobium leguminosarum]|uniref:hypothetical protein n=1 Tax=Rhizobium leguminosarum TaxID=384 RepID=UPI001C944BBE|nr:hypothetical protein [Rhizobium leguminosarum]